MENSNMPQPVQKNGIGTTGFVFALLGLIFCWLPVINWILWAVGLILSFIGLFKKPKGLAITGMILSCIAIIVILVVLAAVGAAFSL